MSLQKRNKRGLLVFAGLCVFLTACQSSGGDSSYRAGTEIRLIRSIPAERPNWLNSPPVAERDLHFFVGISSNASTEAIAKDLAVADAVKKAAAFAGVSIEAKSERLATSKYKASETADPNIAEAGKVLEQAKAYFSRLQPEKWFIEEFGRMEKEQIRDSSYRVSVVLSIPDEEINAAIAEAKRQHEKALKGPGLSKFWESRTQEGVILIDDGCPPGTFDFLRAGVSEFFTQNGILVVQNHSTISEDYPVVGIKVEYSENPDTYGNKSVSGSYALRMFVKDKGGREIVGKTVTGNAGGLAKNSNLARQASFQNFLHANGMKLLQE